MLPRFPLSLNKFHQAYQEPYVYTLPEWVHAVLKILHYFTMLLKLFLPSVRGFPGQPVVRTWRDPLACVLSASDVQTILLLDLAGKQVIEFNFFSLNIYYATWKYFSNPFYRIANQKRKHTCESSARQIWTSDSSLETELFISSSAPKIS